jgi:phage gpG-like protein
MAGFMNLAEAAARFAAAAVDIELAKHAALEEACQIVEERAKGLIGHPNGHWAPLKPETIAHKGGLNMPLLETGDMRDSIAHTVVDSNHGYVGSNDDKAVFQELGTSRGIPPRSFLGLAAQLEGPHVAHVVAQTVGGAIGAGLAGQRVGEFIELARIAGEAFRSLKETASDLLESDEEHKR